MRSSTFFGGFLLAFLVATSQEEDAIEATEVIGAKKKIETVQAKKARAITQKYGLSPRKTRVSTDPCTDVFCEWPLCTDGATPVITFPDCCPSCPETVTIDLCAGILCDLPSCSDGAIPETKPDACCPSCPDLMVLLPSNSNEAQTLLPVQINLTGIVDYLKKEFAHNLTAFQIKIEQQERHLKEELEQQEQQIVASQTKIRQLEEEVESLKENRPSPTTDGGRPSLTTANVEYVTSSATDVSTGPCIDAMCEWPFCTDGATPVTLPGDCCPSCPETEPEGWRMIQMKKGQDKNFATRGWNDYKNGFGSPGLSSTFYWRGLEWLHTKTKCGKWQIKLLWKYRTEEGKPKHTEQFDDFKIDSEAHGYRLHLGDRPRLGGYSRYRKLGLFSYNNGYNFTTIDRDISGCSNRFKGGWWFKRCYYLCLNCNRGEDTRGDWKKDSMFTSETYMFIRKVSRNENCN